MIYINRNPSWRSITLLAILSTVMFLSGICVHELRLSDEGLTAAFTQDFIFGGNIFKTRIYGQPVPGFPLYSWCAAICSLGRMPTELTLRLPTLLALFTLAIASGLFARRIQSDFAGMIAASVVLMSMISVRVGVFAHNDTIVAALLASAWYIVYAFGWRGKRWWFAWGLALLLVLLASFGAGAKALIIFYLPFFSMGHRLKSVEALQSKQHLTAFVLMLASVILWQCLVPGQPFVPWNALAFMEPPYSVGSYLMHLVSMLPKLIVYLLPWTFLAWAPFCLALRQFESDSHCCRFLRTIVVANFVMFLLMPGGSPLHLLPVFGPMAVLIGVYSEIVLRRYQEFFGKILQCCNVFEFAISIMMCALYGSIMMNWVSFSGLSQSTAIFCLIIALAVLVVLAIMLLFKNMRLSFRSRMLWSFCTAALLYIISCAVYEHWRYMRREVNGFALACAKNGMATELASRIFSTSRKTPLPEMLKADGVKQVFLALPTLNSRAAMLVETFYMGCPVRQISDIVAELPKPTEESVVFLLSPFAPADTRWDWVAVSDSVNLCQERGDLMLEQNWNEKPYIKCSAGYVQLDKPPYGVNEMRLYRGTARKDAVNAAKEDK